MGYAIHTLQGNLNEKAQEAKAKPLIKTGL